MRGLKCGRDAAAALVIATAVAGALSACDVSFDFGQPSTRVLESGAADSIGRNAGFEITGSYLEGQTPWTIDLQVGRAGLQHLTSTGNGVTLEAVIAGDRSYFKGREFLARRVGTVDPASVALLQSAGDSWWRSASVKAPGLPNFTDGTALRATFLGSASTSRTDHLSTDGIDSVEFSGLRADVYVAAAEPHRLLRVHLRPGSTIDGITSADLHYRSFAGAIAVPASVIDFGDLSTLPPYFVVDSVDTGGCASPCAVSAQVHNLGGPNGPTPPRKVNFRVSDPGSGRVYGTCAAPIPSGVAYNATVKVSCIVEGVGAGNYNGAAVTATPA